MSTRAHAIVNQSFVHFTSLSFFCTYVYIWVVISFYLVCILMGFIHTISICCMVLSAKACIFIYVSALSLYFGADTDEKRVSGDY